MGEAGLLWELAQLLGLFSMVWYGGRYTASLEARLNEIEGRLEALETIIVEAGTED